MPQAVTITSLPRAFELVKGMQAQGLEWGEGYRSLGRDALAAILHGQMSQAIDAHLDRMAALDQADRRNGSYRRHLLTELGEIELAVPRTRRFAPSAVLRAYARRAKPLDRMILGLLCARPVDSQGRRGAAADPRAAGQPGDGQHGGQAA
jgi:transposase-like protein